MILTLLTGTLVYKVGIFQGVLITMAVHHMVYTHVDKQPLKVMVSNDVADLKRVGTAS